MVRRRGSAMVPLVSSYRLSIVTMSLTAAVWPEFAVQFPTALCSPVETVCYLFTLLIPELVRLSTNFDWPK